MAEGQSSSTSGGTHGGSGDASTSVPSNVAFLENDPDDMTCYWLVDGEKVIMYFFRNAQVIIPFSAGFARPGTGAMFPFNRYNYLGH